jgi:sRNA-binding regulator protein Hfq
MKGIVFIFIGAILIMTGVIVANSNVRIKINNRFADEEQSTKVRNYIGIGLGGLGAVFAVIGLIGAVAGSQKNKRNKEIIRNGIVAQAKVTFVDKNYYVLVNKTPIYSIVEYTYTDSNGIQHSRKINNIDSKIVIRNGIQVGSMVPIKYSAENPAESVLILPI